MTRLTAAQREALEVLVAAKGSVRGGKRRSSLKPFPYVNSRAAHSLVKARLAMSELPLRSNPYLHDERYHATEKGKNTCICDRLCREHYRDGSALGAPECRCERCHGCGAE